MCKGEMNKGELNKGLQPLVQRRVLVTDYSEPSIVQSRALVTDYSEPPLVHHEISPSDNPGKHRVTTLCSKAFHITWVTHNSRVSERMIEYSVKKGEPIILNNEQEVEITSYIVQIVKEDRLNVYAYNICRDHIHILLDCEEEKLSNIVRKLKGKSTQLYKKNHGITDNFSLWAQKFNKSYIENNMGKLLNTMNYISNNREKHLLPLNEKLQPFIEKMISKPEFL